jgi:hypothetical protein
MFFSFFEQRTRLSRPAEPGRRWPSAVGKVAPNRRPFRTADGF